MKKLNLHLHTNYSDGNDTMEDYAKLMKAKGFACLVTTDHDYHMTLEKYEQQLSEAAEVSKRLNFPIFCGLEVSLYEEEAVLLNEEMCKEWFGIKKQVQKEMRKDDITTLDTWLHAKSLYCDFAFILVHPRLTRVKNLYSLFTHYEIANCGNYSWEDRKLKEMQHLMPYAKPVAGIDAHGLRFVKDFRMSYSHLITYFESCNTFSDLLLTISSRGYYEIHYRDWTYRLHHKWLVFKYGPWYKFKFMIKFKKLWSDDIYKNFM